MCKNVVTEMSPDRKGQTKLAQTETAHIKLAKPKSPVPSTVIIAFYYFNSILIIKISACATEWAPAKVLPIGPRTC